MTQVLRVTDDSTREDIAETMASINARAKRVPHIVGAEPLPTEWDRRHEQINLLLDQLDTIK